MSRIGREPITVPAGVDVKMEGNVMTVNGPLGTLTQTLRPEMKVEIDAGTIKVTRPNDEANMRSLHGLTRTLVANMVEGVSKGYEKKLLIVGVGYRAAKQGKTLVLNLGYSHPINIDEADGVTFDVPDPNTIIVKCADKQKCGQIASEIRGKRPPEPYHGKGVKYDGEVIRRKAGKAGK